RSRGSAGAAGGGGGFVSAGAVGAAPSSASDGGAPTILPILTRPSSPMERSHARPTAASWRTSRKSGVDPAFTPGAEKDSHFRKSSFVASSTASTFATRKFPLKATLAFLETSSRNARAPPPFRTPFSRDRRRLGRTYASRGTRSRPFTSTLSSAYIGSKPTGPFADAFPFPSTPNDRSRAPFEPFAVEQVARTRAVFVRDEPPARSHV